jgi:putative restriction endonuclease
MTTSTVSDNSERGLTDRQRWILARVCSLKMWRKGKATAPHKPLLLLVALTRCDSGQSRVLPFVEWESALVPLLRALLRAKTVAEPRYPFWRLQRDELWEVSADAPMRKRQGNTDPLRSELVKKNACGGLPVELFDIFSKDRVFKGRIIRLILERHFSDDQQRVLKTMLRLSG